MYFLTRVRPRHSLDSNDAGSSGAATPGFESRSLDAATFNFLVVNVFIVLYR